jgi:hypothetical protein
MLIRKRLQALLASQIHAAQAMLTVLAELATYKKVTMPRMQLYSCKFLPQRGKVAKSNSGSSSS